MRTSKCTSRTLVTSLVVAAMAITLGACGGGGGTAGSASPGTAGPAAVRVSIASAPDYPAGTTFASPTAASSPVTAAPPGNSPAFKNVFVTVTKVALIPSTGPEFPDANGELAKEDSPADGGKLVTDVISPPVPIDLLNLSGDNIATLLNTFDNVPAGEYSKIRVYYDSVVGQPGGMMFHQTGNYHFDVHFVAGNLSIPVTSDPAGGIEFYSVVIKLVGLKYHQAGSSGNILLRPQVFATVEPPLWYLVTGFADNVQKAGYSGNFDILTLGGRSIPAAFYDTVSGTNWAYSDNVLENSHMVIARGKDIAVPAFENGAIVNARGVFDVDGRLQASHITFTFPEIRTGKVSSTWSADNTYFRLDVPTDNLVYALPDKRNPLYTDFRVPPVELENGYNLIVPNPDNSVKARGYAVTGSQGDGLQAFWISIDNNILILP